MEAITASTIPGLLELVADRIIIAALYGALQPLASSAMLCCLVLLLPSYSHIHESECAM